MFDIAFVAQSDTGEAVADPLARCFSSFAFIGGGLGNEQDLGRWSITLPVNQWLRFDRPGSYRIYDPSTRAQSGDATIIRSTPIELVSEIVTIRITPLTPDSERQLLSLAKAELSQGAEKARSAVEILRFLQTPAARQSLFSLLPKEHAAQAIPGLAASPDPKAEAIVLLQATGQPAFAITPAVIWAYGMLQALGNPATTNLLPRREREG